MIDHPWIGGLDLSTTRTGYAAPNGTIHSIEPHKTTKDPARKRNEIRNKLTRCITINPPKPELAVIEGYSIASPSRWALVHRGELGGMIRDVLFELAIPWVDVPPKSLKLFACGDGAASKTEMLWKANSVIMHDGDHGQPGCANDDEADAFHLRRMGLVAAGLLPSLAGYELEAIAKCGAFPNATPLPVAVTT